MEKVKINKVVSFMEKSINYSYQQNKLFIYTDDKTHIIHQDIFS